MKKEINSQDAPEPIGPYSQAILSNGLLFVSGQIAIDRSTGLLIQDSIVSETHQVMRNLQSILHEAHTDFNQVLKCTIFLKSMEDFSQVNEVYGSYLSDPAPARETVAVSTLPKNVNVEISCIASVGN
jgi:2-iminobutanoate/2-iminopropanoate deaminase